MVLLSAVTLTGLGLALGTGMWVAVRGELSLATGMFLTAYLFYLVFLWANQQNKVFASKGLVIFASLALRIMGLFAAPALSNDLWRYRWEGQVQAEGKNPYLSVPGRERQEVPVPEASAGYGPVVELAERWACRMAAAVSSDPSVQMMWMKMPAVLADVGILIILALFRPQGLAVYGLCPLPVIEFWQNGHNDALALFGLVAALELAERGKATGAFAALGLATAAKWWPAFLILALFRKLRWGWGLAVFGGVILLTALPYYTSDWDGIILNARRMSGYLGGWRNNDSLFGFVSHFGGGKYAAGVLMGIATVGLARLPLYRAALGTLVAVLLLSANCHPWYVTWLIPLVAYVEWMPVHVWAALAPLHYIVLPDWWYLQQWDGSRPERWVVYGPVLGWMIWDGVRRVTRKVVSPVIS